LEENITNPMVLSIKESFQSSADFQYRKFTSGEKVLYLCYLDTMVDSEDIQTHILKKSFRKIDEDSNDTSILEITKVESLEECTELILNGNVIAFYEENENWNSLLDTT
jgi:spore germination protein KA